MLIEVNINHQYVNNFNYPLISTLAPLVQNKLKILKGEGPHENWRTDD